MANGRRTYQPSAVSHPPSAICYLLSAIRPMYSTCLYCHASLGDNEVIERFPVGRRLAFDAHRGRLWVVCRRCERWNLTPLEERWEAIEDCERRFRDTRLRVSTDNIGLASLREGVELVRVGKPQRPEFAAWRYGDQFGRRRRTRVIQVGLGLGALGAVVAGGLSTGVGVGGFWWLLTNLSQRIVKGNPDDVVARLHTEDRQLIQVHRKQLEGMRLSAEPGGREWSLRVRHDKGTSYLAGETAVRAMGMLLPAVNRFGGSREQVGDAVAFIEAEGDAERYLLRAAQRSAKRPLAFGELTGDAEPLSLRGVERLALEMAAHEQSERQAAQGELLELERAWRDAEEIAAISDNLLLPPSIEEFLRKHRGKK